MSQAGVASRRASEELIRAGRVQINGNVARLGDRVAPGDRVTVDGQEITRPRGTVTYMLNKPAGVLSTVRDERGRPTVVELLPPVDGLHPVGRLDLESEGLLLLTTDGDLTMRLTHPRYGHQKTYRIWTAQGAVMEEDLKRLEEGVVLEDGPARAVRATSAQGGCELVLAEGRKRQVRRMLLHLGYEVTRLQRTAIGRLTLGRLKTGTFRRLSEQDIELALENE